MIIPIAWTQVDWKPFIETCQKFLGESPTRGLDQCHIDLRDPAAYLATLGMDNKPLLNLQYGRFRNDSFSVVHFSFMGLLDNQTIRVLQYRTKLETVHVKSGDYENQFLTVIAGSIAAWQDAFNFNMSHREHQRGNLIIDKSLLHFLCECYNFFKQSYFREVFPKEIVPYGQDDLFLLK